MLCVLISLHVIGDRSTYIIDLCYALKLVANFQITNNYIVDLSIGKFHWVNYPCDDARKWSVSHAIVFVVGLTK